MKRAVFVLGLAAFVVMPVAAQWTGMPVWNSPKGGTGVTFSGDWGKPDSSSGKGNAFGARASLGVGTLTLTAGVASYKPENFNASTTSVGGQADFRVIGGSLLPIAVNLQFGAGVSGQVTSGLVTYPKTTHVIGAVGFSIPLPTPGFSVEPYFSPGIRYLKLDSGTASASQTKFGYALGANVGMGLFGLHLAYDYQKTDAGHLGTFGLGAHISLKVPLGM